MLSFPRPISRKLYMIRSQKLKLLIRNHTTVFMCYNSVDDLVDISRSLDCRLFHIKFLVNDAWYDKSYYRLLVGNHTLAFDWCHFWWPWRTFEGHFSPGCHFSDGETVQDLQLLKLFIRNDKWWHSVGQTVVFEENFDYVLMWICQYFVFLKSILKYVFDILVFEILRRKYLVFWYLKCFLKEYLVFSISNTL